MQLDPSNIIHETASRTVVTSISQELTGKARRYSKLVNSWGSRVMPRTLKYAGGLYVCQVTFGTCSFGSCKEFLDKKFFSKNRKDEKKLQKMQLVEFSHKFGQG